MSWYKKIIGFLVNSIFKLGYVGIFALMFLESSFFPFPSEVVMIPAGYLAYQGKMNLLVVILMGILGSIVGAWFNYWLALKFGRKLVLKLIGEENFKKVEKFFNEHGEISTFNGRLIPLVRQYISFPAGLVKMDGFKFTFYTALGAGIWVSILTFLGYFIGKNQELIDKYLHEITIVTLLVVVIITIVYVWIKNNKNAE